MKWQQKQFEVPVDTIPEKYMFQNSIMIQQNGLILQILIQLSKWICVTQQRIILLEEKMYECGRCFLRPQAARQIVAVHKKLQKQNLGLKMYDCYRPRPIQQKLWDKLPDPRICCSPMERF